MEITTPDLMKSISEKSSYYDLSNLPQDHPMHSSLNKKVPGKIKLEMGEDVIQEFIGLKPKMYSILYGEDLKESKKAKGVNRAVVRRTLRHKDYKVSLMEQRRFTHRMRRIGSEKHQLYTYDQSKLTLNPYDDKRFLIDGVKSVPYGYKF